MASYTQRLGLRVDEITDELWAARANWDKLDNTFSGVLWVAPGTTPTPDILYDGAIVAEIGNGKVYRVEKNILGNYDKKWIKYPWQLTVYSTNTSDFAPVGTVANGWGFDSIDYAQSFNATSEDLVGTQIIVPVTGIYIGTLYWRWENSGVGGFKSHQAMYNDVKDTLNSETLKIATTFGNMSTHMYRFNRKLDAGTRVASATWRETAGTPQPYNHRGVMTLVRPTVT